MFPLLWGRNAVNLTMLVLYLNREWEIWQLALLQKSSGDACCACRCDRVPKSVPAGALESSSLEGGSEWCCECTNCPRILCFGAAYRYLPEISLAAVLCAGERAAKERKGKSKGGGKIGSLKTQASFISFFIKRPYSHFWPSSSLRTSLFFLLSFSELPHVCISH